MLETLVHRFLNNRCTSRKIKTVLCEKGLEGEHLTSNTIYGYKKDPEDHNHWIIDEEAAAVVHHIYRLIIEGYGPMQVARILTDEKVEKPSYYLPKQGLGTCRRSCDMTRPYNRTPTTITEMVAQSEPNPLTGLVFCADCGAKMFNHRTKGYEKKDKDGNPTGKFTNAQNYYNVMKTVISYVLT